MPTSPPTSPLRAPRSESARLLLAQLRSPRVPVTLFLIIDSVLISYSLVRRARGGGERPARLYCALVPFAEDELRLRSTQPRFQFDFFSNLIRIFLSYLYLVKPSWLSISRASNAALRMRKSAKLSTRSSRPPTTSPKPLPASFNLFYVLYYFIDIAINSFLHCIHPRGGLLLGKSDFLPFESAPSPSLLSDSS